MDFQLTHQQKRSRDRVRGFAREELAPHAGTIDRGQPIPSELPARLGAVGLMGVTVPRRWEGMGLASVAYVLAMEEIDEGICEIQRLTIASALLSDYDRSRCSPKPL